jgi:predicted MPP superfamily phosphohydrolase
LFNAIEEPARYNAPSMRASILAVKNPPRNIKTRPLPPPRMITGTERRRINPNRGLIKLFERYADLLVSRFVYPMLGHVWSPYCWILEQRFRLAETTLSPALWPRDLAPLRVLLITDIHGGIFLKPETFWQIIRDLMQSKPDLVIIGGDLVTGHVSEATPYLDVLAVLADAPLGAWFCFGNHDYFGGDPEELRENLAAVGIQTLKNESVVLDHHGGSFILGGIDDLLFGKPDWRRLTSTHGTPHLLIAHNPDHFYDAVAHGVALTVSGHTHGGQIRLPNGPPVIRQSRYCLDEGVYVYRSSSLVVSRGLGSVALPWRWGADPEAVLIEIVA